MSSQGQAGNISVVLVNWNNYEDTAGCLESLQRAGYPGLDIVVVENGSDGDDGRLLKERFGQSISLLENGRNWGFAKGCNIGIQDAVARGAEYVVLLNNDTVVPPRFLDDLVEVARSDRSIGIAGGKIYCHEFPDMIWFAGGSVDRLRGRTPIRGSGEKDRGQYEEIAAVDWICSCFMLISREVLEDVGTLDERFFFGWEDVDLCLRASAAGYKVVYVPGSAVEHKGFGRTKRERLQGRPMYYASRGHFLFMDKHFSRSELLSSWLYFAATFPRVVWDYARMTGQWKAPAFIIQGMLGYLALKSKKGPDSWGPALDSR